MHKSIYKIVLQAIIKYDSSTSNLQSNLNIMEQISPLYEPKETTLFSTTNTFHGNSPASNTPFTCRFTVTRAKSNGKLIARPERINEETGQWIPLKPACWYLEDVLHSRGLYVDFGSRRIISPTEEVWQEIQSRLNENRSAGTVF